jgi:hypothetical protein
MDKKVCIHETLSSVGPFVVQRCRECEGLSVHLGAVTVRLDAGALSALSQALADALEQIASPNAPPVTLPRLSRERSRIN